MKSEYLRTPMMHLIMTMERPNASLSIPQFLRHNPNISDYRGWTAAMYWLWHVNVRGKNKVPLPEFLIHDPNIRERTGNTYEDLKRAWS